MEPVSPGGEGGGGRGAEWRRVGGFDSWPLDWMLMLPSLLRSSSSCPSLVLSFPSPCCKRKPFELTWTCVCVCNGHVYFSFGLLARVCLRECSIPYICGTMDRVSLRSRSFYWVWTAEKRFSCFYIEAIFPSRPVAFKNTDFRRSGTAGRLAISAHLPFRGSLVSRSLYISLGSVGLINRYHSSWTRHEIRRDILSRCLRLDCYRKFVSGWWTRIENWCGKIFNSYEFRMRDCVFGQKEF